MAVDIKLCCPDCGEDWSFGWPDIGELLVHLACRVTLKGRHGRTQFDRAICAKCKRVYSLTALGL